MDKYISTQILTSIVDCLQDDIDLVCFALTCRRHFKLFGNKLNTYINNDGDHDRLETYAHSIMSHFNSVSAPKEPAYTSKLKVSNHFNEQFQSGALPQSLFKLSLGFHYNQPLKSCELPQSLVVLVLGGNFNQPIERGSLPNSLQCLTFGYHFNEPLLPQALPPSLTTITFGYTFDQPLTTDNLPPYLLALTFGHSYSHPILPCSLPESLTYLRFGTLYNQHLLPYSLPRSLRMIKFGPDFNQSLSEQDVLPPNLTKLSLAYDFNQPLSTGVLPDSLILLVLGHRFNCEPSKLVIPINLQSLEMGSMYQLSKYHHCLVNSSVKIVYINSYIGPQDIINHPTSSTVGSNFQLSLKINLDSCTLEQYISLLSKHNPSIHSYQLLMWNGTFPRSINAEHQYQIQLLESMGQSSRQSSSSSANRTAICIGRKFVGKMATIKYSFISLPSETKKSLLGGKYLIIHLLAVSLLVAFGSLLLD
ncbi:hypothetical protein SAMD00019534_047900, partial [Acytostelium subglobosum LB1]|uniref:hypothetical protein n=1 Tax=Acytostelium subglobosum LB1 TaxID=1410327 RepID=UPI0006448871